MALKRIRSDITRSLPSVRLYLDDLDRIFDICRAAGGEVKIECGDYHVDEPVDLRELGLRSIHQLKIRSRHPDVVVILDPRSCILYTTAEDAGSKATLHDIEAILRERRPPLPTLRTSAIVLFMIGWCGFALLLSPNLGPIVPSTSITVGVVVTAGWLILLGYYTQNLNRHSTVIAVRRSEDVGFFQRKRDDLLLGAMLVAVGSVITLVIQLIVE